MFENSLHTANICNCLATIATAADLTLTGGAGLLIGGALSGHAMLSDLPSSQRKMAREMAHALENSHLSAAQQADVARLLAKHYPKEADLLAGNMDASDIAAQMVQRIYADPHTDATPQACQDYRDILVPMLRPHLKAADRSEQMLQELLRRTDQSGKGDILREEGITERAIIRLAQRISADTSDVGAAWTELQNAIEIAVGLQRDGRKPSNHGAFVDAVLARVAELSRDGEYKQAGKALDEAMRDEEIAFAARKAKLMNERMHIAMLDGDVANAAEAIFGYTQLTVSSDEFFRQIEAEIKALGDRGSNEGFPFLQDIAIELCRKFVELLDVPHKKAIAIMILGYLVRQRGEREVGVDYLWEALALYDDALRHLNTSDDPSAKTDIWGSIMTNKANALVSMGERTNTASHFNEALAIFHETAAIRTKEKTPRFWAITQMNIGNTLKFIAERSSDLTHLTDAIDAYKATLTVWTRDAAPLDWAKTKMNLGNALALLGYRTQDPSCLSKAREAFDDCAQEWTRSQTPMKWALLMKNAAAAEFGSYELTGDTANLHKAVFLFREALPELDGDHAPLEWASTQSALGNALIILAEKENDPELQSAASQAFEAASTVITSEQSPREWMGIQVGLLTLKIAQYNETQDLNTLHSARAHLEGAMKFFGVGGFDALLDPLTPLLEEIDEELASRAAEA